ACRGRRGGGGLEDLVRGFLADGGPTTIDGACFGVAGPVVDGRADATNLPWHLDEGELAERVPAGRVRLLNDLEATGRGVLGLPPEALATLQPGRAQRGNMAIIAAGTRLGEALLVWGGTRYVVAPSEGGHADLPAPSQHEL